MQRKLQTGSDRVEISIVQALPDIAEQASAVSAAATELHGSGSGRSGFCRGSCRRRERTGGLWELVGEAIILKVIEIRIVEFKWTRSPESGVKGG